jgi:hypothetical protein
MFSALLGSDANIFIFIDNVDILKQSTEIKPLTCPNRPAILSHNVVSNTPP